MERRTRGKIGIVGGGAAGMAAAVLAARHGAEVTVLEGNDRVGRKLLSTGNGKCNLGNLDLTPDRYNASGRERLAGFLERFGSRDTVEFFRSLGLLVKQKNGGLYPVSEQAASVLDALRFALERDPGIRVMTECKVDWIEPAGRGKRVRLGCGKKQMDFDRVILTCGGRAAPGTGSDGSGYRLAEMLGHSIVPVVPALVQLKCREEWFKSVAGVRAEGKITLEEPAGWDAAERPVTERGELQFTDYGLSGIPVFQISGRVNYILREEKEVTLRIDFLPDDHREGFAEKMLRERIPVDSCSTLEEYFTGMLNKKLMTLLIKLAGAKPTESAREADIARIRRVYELCRELKVHVIGSNSFAQAQVCAGGVPLEEITDRLESVKAPGVYFAGEILDVDGRCGGYNLHWAWCSGCLAGRFAAESL